MSKTEELSKTEPTTVSTSDEQSAEPEQVNRLGTAKLGKLILEFAIPSIVAMLVNGLYNIIDGVFMGLGVGEMGQAVATVSMPIMLLSIAISAMIGAGGNALVALRLGEGKRDEAEHALGQACFMVVVGAIVATILVNILMGPLLSISGADPSLWTPSATNTNVALHDPHIFIHIISAGFILQFFGMGFSNFIRTAGAPKRALWTMLAGSITCIILNFLFVIVLHMGVAGSATATIIGQGVSAVLVLYYFIFSKKAPFKLHLHYILPPVGRFLKNITALGVATFVLQIANSIINLVLNNQLAIYGAMAFLGVAGIGATAAQASVGVAVKVIMVSFFPLLGVAMAVQPLIGYNYGAKLYHRVKRTFLLGFCWTFAIGLFFWLLVHLFPGPIASLFGLAPGTAAGDYCMYVLQVQAFFLPILGIQILGANFFQSVGSPLKSMFLSLTRQLLYLIPLILLLPFLQSVFAFMPFGFHITPLDAVNLAYPTADILAVITSVLMMWREFKRLTKMQKEQAELGQGYTLKTHE
ncbi:MAG: MATE family efflux transporter [Coriobacteriales bacterium]|jgi:putative MATE family efflux protein|nr:MATE family efflux transporter [Coriobacteriales bacterium]